MNICPLSCISCKASIDVVENQATSDVENGANPQASAPRQLFIDWYIILSVLYVLICLSVVATVLNFWW